VASSVAEQRYQAFKNQGYQSFFYIAEDGSGQTADANYCKQIRAQYGLTMPVLYGNFDELAAIGFTGSVNEWNIVLSQGGKVELKQKGIQQNSLNSFLEGILSD
jgi:hypothetical protein